MTDVSKLGTMAQAISTSSSKIRAYAIEDARVDVDQEKHLTSLDAKVSALDTRLTKLEPVVTPPPPPPPPPGAFTPLIGFSGRMGNTVAEAEPLFAWMASVGAKIFRTDLAWAWMEPTRGNIDFTRSNTMATLCRKYDMKALPILGFTPAWARPAGTTDKHGPTKVVTNPDGTTTRVHDPEAFGFYCGKQALWWKSYGADVLYGFEPLNEPNHNFLINTLTGKWGDPDQYVPLLNAAHDGIKGNSDFKVIGGATAGPGYGMQGSVLAGAWNEPIMRWVERVLDLGARFDEWSAHPYDFGDNQTGAWMTRLTEPTGIARVLWHTQAESLREQLSRKRSYAGPIHGTEAGCPTDRPDGSYAPSGTPEAEQADLVKRLVAMWRPAPQAGHLLFYTPWDFNSWDTTNRENHFGFRRSDGVNKPAAAAFKAAVSA